MTDSRDGWARVSAELRGLGPKLNRHLEEAKADPDVAADVGEGLRSLRGALDAGFTAMGDAVRDEEVRQDLSRLARSVADALRTSLAEAGQEVARAVRSSDRRDDGPSGPGGDGPSGPGGDGERGDDGG